MSKGFAREQGLVGNANLNTIFQREIFFQVDPATLDYLDGTEVKDLFPSGIYHEFNPEEYLNFLPDLEREIFFMVFRRKKQQKDVARLLGVSQPTVSYRYRRAIQKLCYLITLQAARPEKKISSLSFLKEKEQKILLDLFYHTNQEMVAKKHSVPQSTVKWVFVKAKRRVSEFERKEPEIWDSTYALLLLLEKNLSLRVLH